MHRRSVDRSGALTNASIAAKPIGWAAMAVLSALALGPAQADGLRLSASQQLSQSSMLKVAAQPVAGPELGLRRLLEAVQAQHPSLKASRLQAQAAGQDLAAAQRQRWPTVSVVAEGEAATRTNRFPTQALRVEQTVWDAGRTGHRVSEAERRSQLSQVHAQLLLLDLSLQATNAWQGYVGAAERLEAARETLERLRGYEEQMQRRVDAQASPRIDLEFTQARLLQTEVELATAHTAMQTALNRLEQLSGLPQLAGRLKPAQAVPSLEAGTRFTRLLQVTDMQQVAQNHALVNKARQEREVVSSQYAAKQAERWPQIYVRLERPWVATPVSPTLSPAVFAGLRYTPGAGFANEAEAAALAIRVESQDQAVAAAIQDLQQVLLTDRDEYTSALVRSAALERSVEGSRTVLDSYLRQFQAGRKSWQDLLNAARDLAQNQYSLADARASLVGAMHRLQLRLDLPTDLP